MVRADEEHHGSLLTKLQPATPSHIASQSVRSGQCKWRAYGSRFVLEKLTSNGVDEAIGKVVIGLDSTRQACERGFVRVQRLFGRAPLDELA